MKIFYTLIISFVVVNNIYAQSYIRMVDTSNKWDVLCGGITTNGDDLRQTDILQFIGDTIINDTIYTKLYSHVNYTPTQSTFNYVCALREDSAEQKIYKRNNLGAVTTEELLYDFSLQTGDSIILSVNNFSELNPIKIDSIRTEFFAEQNRRIFYVTAYNKISGNNWIPYNIKWIEGIGKVDEYEKIKGPLDNFEWMVDELLCFWQSDQMLYQNPYYSTCLIIHAGIENNDVNEIFKAYPNPTLDYLTIETSRLIKESILIIYSLTGQEVIRQSIKDIETHIDISDFTSGIYFVKLVTEKGINTIKITKQ